MAKNGKTSIEVPSFQQPERVNFASPFGNVNFNKGSNTFEFSEAPGQEGSIDEAKAIRSTILKGLGITSPEREKSRKEFQDTFFKEAERLALPSLTNTLFSKGLGGQTPFFTESVNDLLSKLATQSILNKENLFQQDEQLKLNQLGGVQNVLGGDQAAILDLLGLSNQFNLTQDQLATSRFQSTLPLKSKINKKSSIPVGTLVGLALGTATGNPAAGLSLGQLIDQGAGGSAGTKGVFGK